MWPEMHPKTRDSDKNKSTPQNNNKTKKPPSCKSLTQNVNQDAHEAAW